MDKEANGLFLFMVSLPMKTNMVGVYFVLWTVVILPSLITASPLDEYVYTPDPYYHFTEISSAKGPGYTLYSYNMTSLKWKSGILCTIHNSGEGGCSRS